MSFSEAECMSFYTINLEYTGDDPGSISVQSSSKSLSSVADLTVLTSRTSQRPPSDVFAPAQTPSLVMAAVAPTQPEPSTSASAPVSHPLSSQTFKRLHPQAYLERYISEGYRPDGRKLGSSSESWRDVSVNPGASHKLSTTSDEA